MLKLNIFKNVIFIVIVIAIFLTSCKEENKNNGLLNPSNSTLIQYDADFVISSTVWDEYWMQSNDTLTDHRNYFKAIFSDGSTLVDIDSIFNQFVTIPNSKTGHYKSSYMDLDLYPVLGTYNWTLKNFLGIDTTIYQHLVPRLTITSPLKTDTVSKSGFTLNYSGNNNADEASFELYQADAINKELGVISISDPELSTVRVNFPDVGVINISSTDLTNLIPNRYYQYNIRHTNYDSVNVSGMKGILHSTSIVSQYVYITN